jgi:octaheme c-type cytochrome (tetrathionate reductase family)
MRHGFIGTLALAAGLLVSVAAAAGEGKALTAKADHSQFKVLQQDFQSGPEVTKACLTCHTESAKQIHRTQHWKWEYVNPVTKQVLGKKHVVNNYCTSALSNLESCGTCHIGYGWKDESFDFTSQENVDCLVCHDTTGRYVKQPGLAGHVVGRDMELPPGSGKIVKAIDLKRIAQRVGRTSRATCGTCHFYGGGGDGVKHGDMDSSLESPDKALDVHMDAEGNNFTCVTCHETQNHQVPGSRYAPTARDTGGAHLRGKKDDSNPVTCQACHGQKPHKPGSAKLNDHTDRIACQTCHIPKYARGGVPTKLAWDWSTAGQRGPDGKPLIRKNAEGQVIYIGTKGDFELGENVIPDYIWFNGTVKYTLVGDKIESNGERVPIGRFEGSANDGRSLIWPVKVFRGKQAYDPVNKSLVVTHLAGDDDSAYWTNLDWSKAVRVGMAAVNAPFSGEVAFIETESMWPITHMVAPAKDALACKACHAANGRLEKVSGIYMPGRASDHATWLDASGWTLAGLMLLGVVVHGIGRVTTSGRKR